MLKDSRVHMVYYTACMWLDEVVHMSMVRLFLALQRQVIH